MRELLRNVITVEEAEHLMATSSAEKSSEGWEHPVRRKIIDACFALVPDLSLESPSYFSVECKKDGHKVHKDTGNKYSDGSSHMAWCRYGGTLLLTHPDSFSGGEVYYPDTGSIPKEDHYLSVVFHDSDQLHGVTAHCDGDRKVFLLFFG